MRRLLPTMPFFRSRKAQRRHVIVLTLALCAWMIGYAMHVHAADGSSPQHGISHACTFCLSQPSGVAPPPANGHVPAPFFVEIGISPTADAPACARGTPSSYRSRAPPAL